MPTGIRRLSAVCVIAGVGLSGVTIAVVARQPANADLAARIARVEQGLLPGIVIAGTPSAPMKMADRMTFYATPGVSVAVINDGAIEWTRGYGVVEAGSATPVTTHTRFQAASISKPVAALGAMLLVAQGRLALDEPVNSRLTSWKVPDNEFTAKQPVTLRQLLSHTAGLTVHGFGGYEAGSPVPALAQVLDGQKPANSAPVRVDGLPGSINRYSGGGFTVAQQLLVDTSGKPFPSLLSELVLVPLGMTDSTYEQPLPAPLAGQAASGHRRDGKPIAGRYHTYPELAAAGLWTTPTDLATFVIELQRALAGTSRAIPTATAREMTTVQKDNYGLGLSLPGTGTAARFGHGGSNEGFRCEMVGFLAGGKGAVVMTNGDRGGALAAEILRSIAREYGWAAYRPQEKRVVPLDRATLAALQGRYEVAPGHVFTVRLVGQKLFVFDRDERGELLPESPTRFFDPVDENTLEFVKEGDAVSHVLINGSLRCKRIGPA